MKDISHYLINEYKTKINPNLEPIKFIQNSQDFYHGRDQFIKLIEGKKAVFYHGTNVDFKKFNPSTAKKNRNDKFFGGGIFLTPNFSTANRYANANMNNSLHISILDKAKKVDKRLYSFMYDLYYKGNSTWSDKKHREFLDMYEFRDVDMNEIADIVNLIPNSQSQKDYTKGDDTSMAEIADLFSNTSSALDFYHIENLKKLGLGDYRTRVLTVEVNGGGASILVTDNQKQARKSNDDLIIVYSHDDLVDGVPELIVRDAKRIKIIGSEVVD